jgi:hypothetical protein
MYSAHHPQSAQWYRSFAPEVLAGLKTPIKQVAAVAMLQLNLDPVALMVLQAACPISTAVK